MDEQWALMLNSWDRSGGESHVTCGLMGSCTDLREVVTGDRHVCWGGFLSLYRC